jgi:L-2-hydroxyglutarate oxidase LhgO
MAAIASRRGRRSANALFSVQVPWGFTLDTVQTLVVGAGVVGLAVAACLARAGHEVLVIDKAMAIGTETSSRNSEVVHAGIYYPARTLKARLCVEGKELLYRFCAEHGVEVRRTGKLIVAVGLAEVSKLEDLQAAAERNGVTDLTWLSREAVAELEPDIRCSRALLSPSTGIVDSHGYMLALQGEALSRGAMVSLGTAFEAGAPIEVSGAGFEVRLRDVGGDEITLACRNLVNCAGHGAHAVAGAIAGFETRLLPPRFLAKGSYCAVSGRSPFRHLIYPMPVPGALGVHVTLDMGGAVRLGPNIEWVSEVDYSVSSAIAADFADACATYWPGVRDRTLTASYCGVRPKIHGPGESFADFAIQGADSHGMPGLVSLFGIESPGLTASLAIGEQVRQLLA